MPKITVQQAREKHASRLKASTGEIQRQVNAVTTAPGIQAAKKADKMLTNITNAITSGRWGRRVSSVSLQDWQSAMINKGIPRISQGIDAAAPKVEAFFAEFFPHLEKIEAEVKAMPDLTLEDNINRAVHAMRRASEFKRGQRG
jgi:hypothetical protein